MTAGWRRRLVSRLVFIALSAGALGEAGHLLFEHLREEAGHHVFHLLFPMVALVLFGLSVATDVRKNGWPSFSWRLRAEEAFQEEARELS